MHVDRAFVDEGALPNGREQLRAREDATGLRREDVEELEFLGGELQRHAVGGRLEPRLVHDEGAAAHDHLGFVDAGNLDRLGGASGVLVAAQNRTHARDQFAREEGLHDVVVRTRVQPRHAVDFVASGRQHDDGKRRRRAVGAKASEPRQSRIVRQHHVEEHQVGH